MHEQDLFAPLPSLEDDLAKQARAIDEFLCEYYAHDDYTTPTNDKIEYDNPAFQFRYILLLTTVLGDGSKEQFEAAYSAYHFAITVADMVGWVAPGPGAAMSNFEYISPDMSDEETRQLLLDRAANYLHDRPELASLIDAYAGDYAAAADETFRNEAQAICALTCERIEQFTLLHTLKVRSN